MVTLSSFISFFFFNDTATTEIYTLSLHDALPICALAHRRVGCDRRGCRRAGAGGVQRGGERADAGGGALRGRERDPGDASAAAARAARGADPTGLGPRPPTVRRAAGGRARGSAGAVRTP